MRKMTEIKYIILRGEKGPGPSGGQKCLGNSPFFLDFDGPLICLSRLPASKGSPIEFGVVKVLQTKIGAYTLDDKI
jgi:hypothetical protein